MLTITVPEAEPAVEVSVSPDGLVVVSFGGVRASCTDKEGQQIKASPLHTVDLSQAGEPTTATSWQFADAGWSATINLHNRADDAIKVVGTPVANDWHLLAGSPPSLSLRGDPGDAELFLDAVPSSLDLYTSMDESDAGGDLVDLSAADDAWSGMLIAATGAGDDEVVGHAGSNWIDLGPGVDTANAAAGDDQVYDRAGDDVVNVGAGNDQVTGGAGADQVSAGDGDDQLTSGAGTDEVSAGAGSDQIAAGGGGDVVSAGGGDDQVTGGAGTDEINAGVGNDQLAGGGGADTVNAGEGTDQVVVRAGVDTANLGAGSDQVDVVADAGADTINPGEGSDELRLSTSDPEVGAVVDPTSTGGDGVAGNDTYGPFETVQGTEGPDRFVASSEPDVAGMTAVGGAGDDAFVSGTGSDAFHGGDPADPAQELGTDSVSYAQSASGITVASTDDSNVEQVTGHGDDQLTSVETLRGSPQGDTVETAMIDRVRPGLGDDSVGLAGGGHVVAEPEADGADMALASGGPVIWDYSSRTVPLRLTADGNANDGMSGEEDNIGDGDGHGLDIRGGSGNDFIAGDHDANELVGNAGDDRLNGRRGDDMLSGGVGGDQLKAGTGSDEVAGGDGDDVLREGGPGPTGADKLYGDSGRDTLTYAGRASGVTVTHNGRCDDGATDEGDCVTHTDPFELVIGSPSDDRMVGSSAEERFRGIKGADVLIGRKGADVLVGQHGDDRLLGRIGEDTLRGGAGGDRLRGGADADEAMGGGGSDVVIGVQDRDQLFGGPGEDTVRGGARGDSMFGGTGEDTLQGGAGGDDFRGGRGSDAMFGAKGFDELLGQVGPDRLIGGIGKDTLRGGVGRDRFFAADSMKDVLRGGRHRDLARRDPVDVTYSIEGRF